MSIVLVSCKKNDLSVTDFTESTSSAKTVFQNLPTTLGTEDCSTFCINAAGPFVEKSGMITTSWGGPNSNMNTKSVSYIVYNTATDFVVKVTYTKSGQNSNASDLIQVFADGVEKSIPALASGSTATFTFPLVKGWIKCQQISFYIHQEGQGAPLDMGAGYSLYEICKSFTCETSFTGEAKSCGIQREAEYNFTSATDVNNIKIQGGLTNFTGDNAIVTVTGGNFAVSQSTPGGSSNRIIKIEGSSKACEMITINIKWNSTNTGGIITGDWSIKGAEGIAIAPSIAGLECH